MKIFIGADIVPTAENEQLFVESNVEALIGTELLNILRNVDYRMFNLEVPLTDIPSPIKKSGPHLVAGTQTINGIAGLKPDFLSLANNHILDQGEQGLYSTMEILKKHGIPYAGAAGNLEEAGKPYVVEVQGIKLGIYCCAEHEFSIATGNKAGANPFDPLESFDIVQALKKACDYVIVLYHGGKEHYRYPTPYLQKVFRKFARCGADVVIAQHTHCIGCFENYMGKLLVYGQGNFLFTLKHNEFWDSSVGIVIDIDKERKVTWEFLPFISEGNYIKLATGKIRESIISDFNERSKKVVDENNVVSLFREQVEKEKDYYANMIHGSLRSVFWRLVTKLSNKPYKMIYNRQIWGLLNVLRCETHRECAVWGIEEDICE